MEAMALSVILKGTLTVKPAPGESPPEGSNGCGYGISNRVDTQSAALESSSATGNVASPSSFVSLPVDSNMRGRLLQMQFRSDSGPIDVELTQLVTGVTVLSQVQGMLVLEKPASDAITALRVQGTGNFQWVLTGASA